MRKVIALEFITLDGVIQAGGTLGSGKRLFANGTIPPAFKVTSIIIVNYERAGEVKLGEVQAKEIR